MIAVLCREYYDNQTHGTLTVTDEETGVEVFKCRTLELPWLDNQRNISCIPEGYYDVDFRTSAKYPKHFILNDVPGRSFILIHQANYVGSKNPTTGVSDLRGFIAVGSKYGDINADGIAEILNSMKTLNELIKVAPTGFVLEITK